MNKRIFSSISVLIVTLLFIFQLGCKEEKKSMKQMLVKTIVKLSDADLRPNEAMQASIDPERDKKAKEELGYIIGAQAYLYGISGLRMEEYRYGVNRLFNLVRRMNPDRVSDVGEDGVTYNEWSYLRILPNPNMKIGGSPNCDTLYGGVFYKLDKEPMVLTVPEIKDRYFSIQITDAFMSNDGYINPERKHGPNNYLIVGPQWKGTVPRGLIPVRVHCNEGIIAVRILIDGPHEETVVNEIQARFDARPLSNYMNPGKPLKREPILKPDDSGELSEYRRIVRIAHRNPPQKDVDRTAWESFKYIGMSLDRPFDPDTIDPDIKRGMKRAIDTTHDIVAWKVKTRGYKSKSNWSVDRIGGSFGQDYLRRTVGVIQGLFIHDPSEALYFLTYHDEKGRLLNGDKRYTLHFDARHLPPVDAFWSITLYDKSYNLVENPINRYAISDRTKGLKHNRDGSLTIIMQSERPGKDDANWLPTPKGDNFRLTFRMYKPRKVMLAPDRLEDYLPPIREL